MRFLSGGEKKKEPEVRSYLHLNLSGANRYVQCGNSGRDQALFCLLSKSSVIKPVCECVQTCTHKHARSAVTLSRWEGQSTGMTVSSPNY